MGEDNGELVAAVVDHDVVGSHRAADPVGDDAEHGVAGVVFVGVVDGFEVVELDDRHGDGSGRAVQLSSWCRPVAEAGERVGDGLVSQCGVAPFLADHQAGQALRPEQGVIDADVQFDVDLYPGHDTAHVVCG